MRGSAFVAAALLMCVIASSSAQAAVGDTRIARWKSDKTAVFLLMFDDSWPSHFQMAVPALTARGMVATFYINPGKGEYKACKAEWENNVWKAGMAYGNHTFTHKGITDPANAEYEVGECTKEILRIVPGKAKRLISWATPGVGKGKWNIKPEELQVLWTKYHLIDRPPFTNHGAVYHLKTADQMLALADSAIGKGGMEYLVIHGVERRDPYKWSYQDFWPLNFDVFTAVLDGLKERRDAGKLWITDHISWHQYATERDTATLRKVEATNQQIKLELASTSDPELYDQPLTLVTEAPPPWTQASVTQAGATKQYPVIAGKLQFEATPNAGAIAIAPQP